MKCTLTVRSPLALVFETAEELKMFVDYVDVHKDGSIEVEAGGEERVEDVGVKKGEWSEEEVQTLKELYGTVKGDVLAERLNRTKQAIGYKIHSLVMSGKLKRRRKPRRSN